MIPLLVWRRSPSGVFVVTGSANVLLALLSYPIGLPLGPAIALYLLAANRNESEMKARAVIGVATGLLAAYLIAAAVRESLFPDAELLHGGLGWGVAWFAGEWTRLRHEQIVELRREAERERLLAVAEERARIARDLHDSAGHAVNVIAVRAGAARLRHEQEPDRSLVALAAIEELARRTVADIDHVVGALRERDSDDESVGSPPGLSSLDTLVAHQIEAGLSVTVHTAGTPRPMGRAADQAVYRILQEALTNVSRHGGDSARVDICFGDAAVDVTVTNDVVDVRPSRPGGGHGIVGMQERASLAGGELATRQADGMFRVDARLPYGGSGQ